MAETFRRGKIIDIVESAWNLEKEMIPAGKHGQRLPGNEAKPLGQMQALDLVIKELIKEFGITEEEMK